MRFVFILTTIIFTGLSFLEYLAPGLGIFRFVNVLAVLSFLGVICTFIPKPLFVSVIIHEAQDVDDEEIEIELQTALCDVEK